MISGNQNWQNALVQPQKQALYIFEIPSLGVILSSFPTSQIAAAPGGAIGGYGVAIYGIGGYGT